MEDTCRALRLLLTKRLSLGGGRGAWAVAAALTGLPRQPGFCGGAKRPVRGSHSACFHFRSAIYDLRSTIDCLAEPCACSSCIPVLTASNCISTYGIQCCGHCKTERDAEPVACTGQHPPSHYLLSTTTTKHPLSINAALPNISMDIVQGLARYPTRFAVQGAAPATLLHEFSCNQILQYEIWCCSHCNSEQHAEPFACIRSSFSSGALRLQPGMFFTCVSVVLGFHGGIAVMPYSFKFLAGLQAVVETCRKQQRSKELFSRCV